MSETETIMIIKIIFYTLLICVLVFVSYYKHNNPNNYKHPLQNTKVKYTSEIPKPPIFTK